MMELELGLKITKTKDDIASISHYQLVNDKGPVFQSRETNTAFVLTAHLKGYKRNNIDIKISKDGSRISISGEKPIQEMVMMGWVMHRKMVDLTGFNKVFKIPEGVNLDKIKANYDEEEWNLSIVLPKLRKGICGHKIEEVKEEDFDKGKSKPEKSEISRSSVGETSQKGSKGSETTLEEKEGEIANKMLVDAKKELNKDTIQKEAGESSLGIEDENGESVRKSVGKEKNEVKEKPKIEQKIGVCIRQKIEDTRQDKEDEVQKMENISVEGKEGGESKKMLDEVTIKKDKEEIDNSKLRIEEGDRENVEDGNKEYAKTKSSELESLIQQSRESDQREFHKPMFETEDRLKESSEEPFEATKISELEQNLFDISQKELKDSMSQQMEKTRSTKEKMHEGECQKEPIEPNKDIHKIKFVDTNQKDIIKHVIKTDDGDQTHGRGKFGKEGFDEMASTNEEIPEILPKTIPEESEGLNVAKMQEDKDVKDEMFKRKDKEIEYFVKKGMVEKPSRMHEEGKKETTRETKQEEIGKRKNEIEGSVQHIKETNKISNSIAEDLPKQEKESGGSKGFNVARGEDKKEAISKTKSFIEKVEGEESKKRNVEASKAIEGCTNVETLNKKTEGSPKDRSHVGEFEVFKEINQDHKDENEHDIEKFNGKGSINMHVELDEAFKEDKIEKELKRQKLESSDQLSETVNADNRIIDGRKGQKFPVIKEDVKEEGAKIEQSEANEGFKKDITRETSQNEIHYPKNQIKEKDKSNLQEEMGKGKFQASNNTPKSEFSMVDSPADRSGYKVTRVERTDGIKEKGANIVPFVKKEKEEKYEKIQVEAHGGLKNGITRERENKEREEPKIPISVKDHRCLQEERTRRKKYPMKKVDSLTNTIEEPKDKKIERAEEIKGGVDKRKMEKIESIKGEDTQIEELVKKVKGETHKKLQVEENVGLRNETTKKSTQKEKDPFMDKVEHEVYKKVRDPLMEMQNSLEKSREGPKDKEIEKAEEIKGEVEERESITEKDTELEELVSKVNREIHKQLQVEENEGLGNDTTKKSAQKEKEQSEILIKVKDQQGLQEVDKGGHEENQKVRDSPMDTYSKETVKKVKDVTHEKIQVEENESLRNDRTKETTQKEKEEPHILTKVKGRQCLEDMDKAIFEGNKIVRDSPMEIENFLEKTRGGPKEKEIEEAEEVKGEVAKRKMEEREGIKEEDTKIEDTMKKVIEDTMKKVKRDDTNIVESATKKNIKDSERERITQILKEPSKEKHPKALEVGISQKELQAACEEIVSMRTKEVEKGSAKDNEHKKNMLPKGKEAHKYMDESMNQAILKTKGTKEIGGKCDVETLDDQVVKPLSAPKFPTSQQSEVEEKDEVCVGSKARYEASLESKKEDPLKPLQTITKPKETLKPKIPLEKHLEKEGQVNARCELHKGQFVGETIREMDMSKEYEADADKTPEKKETKKGLERTSEQEEYTTTQNVKDERLKIHGKIIKYDIDKMDTPKSIMDSMKTNQTKEHPIKSENDKKETKSLEAISSPLNVTSMGDKEAIPKNDIREPHQKELSPLIEEIKSKEPIEVETPIMQLKFPKAEDQMPVLQLRDKEQHGSGIKEMKAPKITTYEGDKPLELQRPATTQKSTNERNNKSENIAELHEIDKRLSMMDIVENKETDILQPQVLENECIERKIVDKQEELPDECEFQDPKVLVEDRDQQFVQDNNDKKGYQTSMVAEEEAYGQKKKGLNVAKSEEPKDFPRLTREEEKTTQTTEEKPKMKKITPQSEKDSGLKQVVEKLCDTGDKDYVKESEVTYKMEVEPLKTIEKTPRKEPHELTRPKMDHEISKIEEVKLDKKKDRHIHALVEATISEEEESAQHTNTQSKKERNVEPKGEIDKPQVNQPPSRKMISKDPHELDEFHMKGDLKGEISVKEPLHSTKGITLAQPSKHSSLSCNQQFEKEGEEKIGSNQNQEFHEAKKGSKIYFQESTKCKTGQNIEQLQEQGLEDTEEEKAYVDATEVQRECEDETVEQKKDDKTMLKKLFAPLAIAGSVLLVSIVVLFVRHKRARKRY